MRNTGENFLLHLIDAIDQKMLVKVQKTELTPTEGKPKDIKPTSNVVKTSHGNKKLETWSLTHKLKQKENEILRAVV